MSCNASGKPRRKADETFVISFPGSRVRCGRACGWIPTQSNGQKKLLYDRFAGLRV